MPRKLPELVGRVKESIQYRFPEIPWVEIDGVPETVVAQRLRNHTMFFAAQHLEGCPLTALEAMACGCLVAGFPGTEGFSHPYASASNGYWANDNDAPSAIRAVVSMIEDSRVHPEKIRSVLENGLCTAQVYSKNRVLEGLERFVEGLPSRNSDGVEMHRSKKSRIPEERWNWADFLFAQRKMHHYNRLTGLTGRFFKTLERLRSSS
jgi:glycosyltransferase involved in cell wall biosynthesis